MHAHALRLEGADDGVVMRGVGRRGCRTAASGGRRSPSARRARAGRPRRSRSAWPGRSRVVEADFRVIDRRLRLDLAPVARFRRSARRGSGSSRATLSSDPPSQYCIDRNQARRSCALPGMKRRICGSRRSIFIWLSPDEVRLRLGLQLLQDRHAPDAGLPMSRSPICVRFTISVSAITPTIASQCGRRA